MKKRLIAKYECGLCQTEYDDGYNAEECEAKHKELAGVLRVGAKVTYMTESADSESVSEGVVLGFAMRDGDEDGDSYFAVIVSSKFKDCGPGFLSPDHIELSDGKKGKP